MRPCLHLIIRVVWVVKITAKNNPIKGMKPPRISLLGGFFIATYTRPARPRGADYPIRPENTHKVWMANLFHRQWVTQFDVQLTQLFFFDQARCLRKQVLRTLGFGESDDIADGFSACHQGDEAIQTKG